MHIICGPKWSSRERKRIRAHTFCAKVKTQQQHNNRRSHTNQTVTFYWYAFHLNAAGVHTNRSYFRTTIIIYRIRKIVFCMNCLKQSNHVHLRQFWQTAILEGGLLWTKGVHFSVVNVELEIRLSEFRSIGDTRQMTPKLSIDKCRRPSTATIALA